MSIPNTKSESFMLAEVAYANIALIEKYLNEIRKAIFSFQLTSSFELDTDQGLIVRIIALLRSLKKLNEPGDWQSISHSARSSFECAIDFILLVLDSNNFNYEMLRNWENKSKQRRELQIRKMKGENIKIPSPLKGWTNLSIREASTAADKVSHFALEKYYIEHYSMHCWNVHGSGLAGVRFVSDELFPIISCFGYMHTIQFARIIAGLLTRKYKIVECFAQNTMELNKELKKTIFYILERYPDIRNEWLSKINNSFVH